MYIHTCCYKVQSTIKLIHIPLKHNIWSTESKYMYSVHTYINTYVHVQYNTGQVEYYLHSRFIRKNGTDVTNYVRILDLTSTQLKTYQVSFSVEQINGFKLSSQLAWDASFSEVPGPFIILLVLWFILICLGAFYRCTLQELLFP